MNNPNISELGASVRILHQGSSSLRSASPRAFTLVELLTVIAIVAILVALSMVGISSMRTNANTAKCTSNLKQLFLSAQNFSTDNNGYLPQAAWYLPQNFLGRAQFKYPSLIDYGADQFICCPESPSLTRTSYGMNKRLVPNNWSDGPDWGPSQYRYYQRSCFKWINLPRPDRTILFCDTGAWAPTEAYFYAEPDTLPADPALASVAGANAWRHKGKFNAVFCDGHVETIAQNDPKVAVHPYPYFWNGPPIGWQDYIDQ
jgi:prepilin-type N-terminal cleavage/methylation domain-containing protein/prepilin-type processing-associated H-X9-DG protein